jgi:hypothetical protein
MDKGIEQAAQRVDTLAQQIRDEGLTTAFASFDEAIAAFEKEGFYISTILPSDAVRALGAATPHGQRVDGRTFWSVYREVVCDALCNERSDLNKSVKAAVQGSTSALVTTVLAGLGLPLAALGIAVTVSGILVALGVDAFCRYRRQEVSASE